MAQINLPQAYSQILDAGYTLRSLTAPAFKGKYKIVNGTTKTFKIYTPVGQEMRDYSTRKDSSGGVGSFGYEYKSGQNEEQVVNVSQDKYFAISIDKADAKFSRDGSLNTKEFMEVQLNDHIYPMMDKYNIATLATAGKATVQATTDETAYKAFSKLYTAQTNAKVPVTGRVGFVSASFHEKIKLDKRYMPDSERTAKARNTGIYGNIDGVLIIAVPDDYMPAKVDMILTHELAAAAPKELADYNQGEFKESASGYFCNGRVVFDAFVFNKKKAAVQVLKSA